MRSVVKLWACRKGASLAEFALMLPLMLLMTFGMLETGFFVWQVQQGEIAANRAVRLASTRTLLIPGSIADCGPGTPPNAIAGQECSHLAGNDLSEWAVCYGDGTGSPAGRCGPDVAALVTEIQRFYPRAEPENIVISFHGAGLGFQGLGHPVPIITVKFEGVQFRFMALAGLADLAPITLPDMSASAAAEDLRNG